MLFDILTISINSLFWDLSDISSYFQNHFIIFRTRIVAPDPSRDTTQPEVNDYFVNDNGEVFTTPKALKIRTTPGTKLTEPDQNIKNFRNKKEYVPKLTKTKSVDLEPLLEEPLKDNFGTNNDDEVEVIQSKENQDDKKIEKVTEETEHEGHNETSILHHDDDEEEYEDDEHDNEYYSDDEPDSIDNSNDIRSEGHHKHEKGNLHEKHNVHENELLDKDHHKKEDLHEKGELHENEEEIHEEESEGKVSKVTKDN